MKTIEFTADEIEFINEQARRQYEREMQSYQQEQALQPPDEFSVKHLMDSANQISMARTILLKTSGRIQSSNPFNEDWQCECGNTETSDGFYPCNAVGEEVEPSAGEWLEIMVCGRCGHMYTHDGVRYGQRHPEARVGAIS